MKRLQREIDQARNRIIETRVSFYKSVIKEAVIEFADFEFSDYHANYDSEWFEFFLDYEELTIKIIYETQEIRVNYLHKEVTEKIKAIILEHI